MEVTMGSHLQQTSKSFNGTQNFISNPQIGHVYSVRHLDGHYFPAELLEIRVNEEKGKAIEYFIHFENCKYKRK
jgi:hypothetical protein